MTESPSPLLKLRVGGRDFETCLSTFDMVPLLQRRLDSTDGLGFRQENGVIILDRDPDAFTAMLKICRGYSSLSKKETRAGRDEFSFWGVQPMTSPSDHFYRFVDPNNADNLIVCPSSVLDTYLPNLVALLESSIVHSSRHHHYKKLPPGVTFPCQALQQLIACVQDKYVYMSWENWHCLRLKFGLNHKCMLEPFAISGLERLDPSAHKFTVHTVCVPRPLHESSFYSSVTVSDGTTSNVFTTYETKAPMPSHLKQETWGEPRVWSWDITTF
jgi:hypothetical protein